MAISNDEKIEAIKFAKEYHQNYYELLPDWFQYDFENYELIRHKIGYALFGLPKIDIDAEISNIFISCTSDNNQSEYIFKKIIYDKTMCKVINTIYEKIIKYGKDNNNSSIYIGIIFNIIFLQTKVSQKSNEKDNASNKENNNICILPIFKLKTLQYDTWFIDNEGRIYKTWKDYISNNTLPPCTMILPKNGLYQCNPNYKVTEYFSSVWIEILDSPACTFKNKVLKGIDVAVNAMSIISNIGLSAASFLTPIGPAILTTGLIHGGICGTWIIVRNSQKLIDLATHKQSINPINKNAFSAWFEVSSTALTLGANSGTMLISKALSRGCTISAAAKVAYNSVILSNLTVNGASVIYQGYRLIEKYKMEKNVDLIDIAIFSSQILFFSNTLIKTKLASELIVSSKGTILEKLKNALRVNRLKQEFNKIKAYSTKEVQNKSESIIYKIKEFTNKEDFLNSLSKMNWKNKFSIKYQNGNIVINNKIFIHPLQFTTHLLTIGAVTFNLIDPHSSIVSKERNYIMINLKILIKQLLKNFYAEKQYSDETIPDVNYFNEILQEIKYMDNAIDVLSKCFKIAVIIVEHCNDPRQFLCDAVYFSWIYCKGNLNKYGINIGTTSKNKIFNELARIVTFLYECIEVIANELFSAFYAYISTTKPEINNYIMLSDN